MGMDRKVARIDMGFLASQSGEVRVTAAPIDDKRGVVPAIPANRFEIISDGPRRFVLVDNYNDDPAPVYVSLKLAKAAKRRTIREFR